MAYVGTRPGPETLVIASRGLQLSSGGSYKECNSGSVAVERLSGSPIPYIIPAASDIDCNLWLAFRNFSTRGLASDDDLTDFVRTQKRLPFNKWFPACSYVRYQGFAARRLQKIPSTTTDKKTLNAQ